MTKIIANKPQHLKGVQFRLAIGSVSITDELRVRSLKIVSDLSDMGLTEPFKSFIFPEGSPGTFNMDFSEAPADISEIDILVDAQITSFRSWSLTGLSEDEFWQNDGVEIASGASCLMLSFSKSIEGSWNVTARNKFEGEESYGVENSNLPDDLRSLAAQASARGLGKNSSHFSILIDTTQSMQEFLEASIMHNLINVIRAISASKNNKAIFVSAGGAKNDSIGLLESADKKYMELLGRAQSDKDKHFTPVFSETLEKTVKSGEVASAMYVITDSMPWIDVEEISKVLEEKNSHIFVILTSKGLGIELMGLSERIMLISVSDGLDEDPKDLMKRFL